MFNKVLINPIELEYLQFTMDNKDRVYHYVSEEQMNIYPSRDELGRPCLVIPFHYGEQICKLGDYIIRDPNSKDWPKFICFNQEVFERLMKLFNVVL